MPRTLIACGSNLGDRKHTLTQAIERLAADPSIEGLTASSFHETAPIGGPPEQAAFLNAAVACQTSLAPEQLLERLLRIESELGRQRQQRWGPRAIDLDVLLYDEQVLHMPRLEIPHPRMTFRRFVLAPAAEIAPDWIHPVTRWSIGRLLAHLDRAADYVALVGLPGMGKTALARRAAAALGVDCLKDSTAADRAAADPSGPELERQIQFLDRATSLTAQASRWEHGRMAISDFFFDQCLAYARLALEDADYERFHQHWAQARGAVVQPKLLVVLDDVNALAAVSASSAATGAAEIEPLRRALLTQVVDKGPVLCVGRDDIPQRLDELTAAVAAMK